MMNPVCRSGPCLSKPVIYFLEKSVAGANDFRSANPLSVPTYHCCHLPAQSFVQCLQAAFEPGVSGTENVKTE